MSKLVLNDSVLNVKPLVSTGIHAKMSIPLVVASSYWRSLAVAVKLILKGQPVMPSLPVTILSLSIS